MPTLHFYWDEHEGIWPPCKDGRRWTNTEINELKSQLNNVGLSQVADAIGSLEFDLIESQLNIK